MTECVKNSWSKQSSKLYSCVVLDDELKSLRFEIKKWQVSLSKLKQLIQKCNQVILFLGDIEEKRPLYRTGFNFRNVVKMHLDDLLLAECN
jgi:hypothetical protein